MAAEKLSQEDRTRRIEKARRMLMSCRVCPRACSVDRTGGKLGYCRTGSAARVASANLHFGEEPPISGFLGSGTIFFSWCNLTCVHCQNFPISQLGHGKEMTREELAGNMIDLQERGAHNINLVTPSHCTPQVMDALDMALKKGLKIPVVWNSSGYESVNTLKLLEGMVDIYMPDLKYSDDRNAKMLSDADDYWRVATMALKEMKRQVGDLQLDSAGLAKRGLLVRHLVLPGDLSGTQKVLKWISEELGTGTAVSLMSQYFPANKAHDVPGMDRKLDPGEYLTAVHWLKEYHLEQGWIQDEMLQGGA
ncbi:MAG: radical SAM protein [Deltaproteobacteria bacterium]|nr:radical SAM protein [Deltaproteobacteria bacterium]